MKLTFNLFQGLSPKISADKLPEGGAQTAQNAQLDGGDVRAWARPDKTYALSTSAYQSLFQWEESSTSHWVTLTDDIDIVRAITAQDAYERLYFSGLTEPRVFANDLVSSPFVPASDYYKLGITAPTAAPTIERSGSTARYYVYTFINTYGEEGPPSPIGGGTDVNNSTPTITAIEAAPATRQITGIRLYRTASGTAGTAEFLYVLEATYFSASVAYDVGDFVVYSNGLYKCTTTHAAGAWNAGNFTAGDDVTDANLAEALTTTTYNPPPTGLEGLCLHPAGFLVGFKGNELYLSEPYLPYAWPDAYRKSVEGTIVGVGITGETIVVITEGAPHLYTGTHPAQMTFMKIPKIIPGLSKRSIVSSDLGVFFASREGLFLIGQDTGIKNVTADVLRPTQWANYHPENMHGNYYFGKYFAWYTATGGNAGLVLDLQNSNFTTLDFYAYAGYVSTDGKFYIITDDEEVSGSKCVKEWEGDEYNYLTYNWKSKRHILPGNTTFTAGRVIIDSGFYDDVMALNESNDYILDANETLFDNSTPSIEGTASTFTGESGDTINVTLNGITYEDIDISGCSDLTGVASMINVTIGTTRASVDTYLSITGGINMDNAVITDGTSTAQTVVGELFPVAGDRYDRNTSLGCGLNRESLNTRTLNGSTLQSAEDLDINLAVTFRLYADDELKATRTITDDSIFRLPAGYRSKQYEVGVTGNIPVRKIELGTSATALQGE